MLRTAAAHLGRPTAGARSMALAIAASFACGAAMALAPSAAPLLLAATGVVVVQAAGWRALAVALVAVTFVTRFRVETAGFNFLIEHGVLAAALLAVFLAGRSRALVRAAEDRTVLCLAAFVVWSAAVSLLRAPAPGQSLAIVGWLALDVVLVVVLVAAFSRARETEAIGVTATAVAAGAAILLWLASAMGVVSFGSQVEHITGAQAAYGLSHEANILGSTMAIWLFVAITSARRGTPAFRAAIALGGVALALSLTRAAALGLVAGLLVWAAMSGARARRAMLRVGAAGAAAAALALALAPGLAAPVVGKLSQPFALSTGTGAPRLESWGQAIADLEPGDWLIGLGSNSFGQRHSDPSFPDASVPGYLGNLPLQIVYDTGLVGAVLLGAAFLSLRPFTRPGTGRAVGLTTTYVVAAVATSPFWFGSTWVLVALAIQRRRALEQAQEPAPEGPAPAPRPAVSAA